MADDQVVSAEELAEAADDANAANATLGLDAPEQPERRQRALVSVLNLTATTRSIHSDNPRSGGTAYQGVIMLGRTEIMRTREEYIDPERAIVMAKENFATRLYNALAKLN